MKMCWCWCWSAFIFILCSSQGHAITEELKSDIIKFYRNKPSTILETYKRILKSDSNDTGNNSCASFRPFIPELIDINVTSIRNRVIENKFLIILDESTQIDTPVIFKCIPQNSNNTLRIDKKRFWYYLIIVDRQNRLEYMRVLHNKEYENNHIGREAFILAQELIIQHIKETYLNASAVMSWYKNKQNKELESVFALCEKLVPIGRAKEGSLLEWKVKAGKVLCGLYTLKLNEISEISLPALISCRIKFNDSTQLEESKYFIIEKFGSPNLFTMVFGIQLITDSPTTFVLEESMID